MCLQPGKARAFRYVQATYSSESKYYLCSKFEIEARIIILKQSLFHPTSLFKTKVQSPILSTNANSLSEPVALNNPVDHYEGSLDESWTTWRSRISRYPAPPLIHSSHGFISIEFESTISFLTRTNPSNNNYSRPWRIFLRRNPLVNTMIQTQRSTCPCRMQRLLISNPSKHSLWMPRTRRTTWTLWRISQSSSATLEWSPAFQLNATSMSTLNKPVDHYEGSSDESWTTWRSRISRYPAPPLIHSSHGFISIKIRKYDIISDAYQPFGQ